MELIFHALCNILLAILTDGIYGTIVDRPGRKCIKYWHYFFNLLTKKLK